MGCCFSFKNENRNREIEIEHTQVCDGGHKLLYLENTQATCRNCLERSLQFAYCCHKCGYYLCGKCFRNNVDEKIKVVPVDKTVRFQNCENGAFIFVGNDTKDQNYTVMAFKREGIPIENFKRRTDLTLRTNKNGNFNIMDNDHKSYFFVDDSEETSGIRTLYSRSEKDWSSEEIFFYKTEFELIPADGNTWRIKDSNYYTYLYVNNEEEGVDHTIRTISDKKFKENPNDWSERTKWKIVE